MTRSVAQCHGMDVMLRDIKPENVSPACCCLHCNGCCGHACWRRCCVGKVVLRGIKLGMCDAAGGAAGACAAPCCCRRHLQLTKVCPTRIPFLPTRPCHVLASSCFWTRAPTAPSRWGPCKPGQLADIRCTCAQQTPTACRLKGCGVHGVRLWRVACSRHSALPPLHPPVSVRRQSILAFPCSVGLGSTWTSAPALPSTLHPRWVGALFLSVCWEATGQSGMRRAPGSLGRGSTSGPCTACLACQPRARSRPAGPAHGPTVEV